MLTTPLTEFKQLLITRQISCTAIDGLDGAGKQTTSSALAARLAQLNFACLIVTFPYYKTPWGKTIDYLLQVSDEALTLKERMLVYALNRLECAIWVAESAVKLHQAQKRPVKVIFDRYPTSNAITYAYYAIKHPTEAMNNPNRAALVDLYNEFWSVDRELEALLGIRSATQIHVLVLDPGTALGLIDYDHTREKGILSSKRDSYEVTEVQELASRVYQELAALSAEGALAESIHVYNQIKPDGSRKQPAEIAADILRIEGLEDIEKSLGIDASTAKPSALWLQQETIVVPDVVTQTIERLLNAYSAEIDVEKLTQTQLKALAYHARAKGQAG